MTHAILVFSIVLQFITAGLALNLIRTTGKMWAWIFIAAAMLLMGIRRAMTLVHSFLLADFTINPITESVALLISCLMFIGILMAGEIFSNFKKLRISAQNQLDKRNLAEKGLRESDEKFRALFDNSPDAVFLTIPDGTITAANPSACAMFGWTEQKMKNNDRFLLLDKDDPRLAEALQKRQQDGWVKGVELTAINKAGDKFPVEVDSVILPGKPLRSFVIMRNISERKLAEEALRRALNFTEVLLEQSPMGIRVFDGDTGICLKINLAAASIAGGPAEILLKQNFRELKSWQNAGLTSVAEMVLADGEARQVETDMVTSFGKTLSVRYFFARFFAEKQPHLLTIGQDISGEKFLIEEKQQMEKKMLHAQKLESLGILAGGIAHDFNNILMAVTGHADLALLRLSTESPAVHNLQQIQIATKKAADLADQMLAYSGKGKFVVEHLDINRVIEEITHILEMSIPSKIQMRFNFSPNLPSVEADVIQLRQVIMNLIINASEAIGEKNGVIVISTGTVICGRDCLHKSSFSDGLSEGLYVYFEVTDTGCGMDKETINRIYDPFFSTKFTGRGLGMAATLGIIRGHKGMISVESEVGQGATFKVLLPKTSSPATLFNEAEDDSSWQGRGKVLLVDDEAMVLAVGKAMLEELGFEVLTASNGCAAVALFKKHFGTLGQVVMDLTMPHMGGEEAFREMRQVDPGVKVIITSGYNEQEITTLFAGKGLSGFIQKPFSFSALRKALATVPASNCS